MRGALRTLVVAAALAAAAACSRPEPNPVLGDWVIDRAESSRGAVLAAEATDLAAVTLRRDAIVAKGVEIPVTWAVEGDTVRALRGDGRGEHVVHVLPDGRIRVELPIGVTAVYAKAGP
jgi:hypothetical protein